jgi:pimeloyl-ACP methyl ester carboxylesterase
MVAHNWPESLPNCWPENGAASICFAKTGSGPPLLLLHGLLGGSFCWRFNIAEFSARRTTLAVDMAGMGISEVPRRTDCGMRAQSQRLLAFIEANGLHDIDLIGSSWGGGVALLLAAESKRIRSLILVAPVNPWSDFGRGRVRFFSGRLGGFLVHCGLPFAGKLHEIGVERMYGDISRIRPGTLQGYSALLRRRGRAASLVNILRHWDADVAALHDAIPRVNVPALLIWGSRDGAVDPRSSERLQQSLARSKTVMLPEIGHLPFEESPEVFNRLVLDFIERPV